MKKFKDFFKKHPIAFLLLIFILFLGIVLLVTYLWFNWENQFPPGYGLDEKDWISFWGSALAFSGTIILGIVAVWQNKQAYLQSEQSNKISSKALDNSIKEMELAAKPFVQCFLQVYFTKHEEGEKVSKGSPYIVLVTQNFGKSTAFNIKVDLSLPNQAEQSELYKYAHALNNQTFTLAPNRKLSTPICWKNETDVYDNMEIAVQGSFDYYTLNKEWKTDIIPKYSFTTGEKDLFDAINFVKENEQYE